MEPVLAGKTRLPPFKVETLIHFENAIWSCNDQSCIFDSWKRSKQNLPGTSMP